MHAVQWESYGQYCNRAREHAQVRLVSGPEPISQYPESHVAESSHEWCTLLPRGGAHCCPGVVHIAAEGWCTLLPRGGAHCCRGVMHIAAEGWCTLLPRDGEG